jgi:sterol desaturase/sphingolipid hydroxylase (fatty acid hydroxylase superfamily)
MTRLRKYLRKEIESPEEQRRFGTGWISGIVALIGSTAAFLATICTLFPSITTMPQLQHIYDSLPVLLLIHAVMALSFLAAILNLVLRRSKVMGFTAIFLVLAANFLGNLQGRLPSAPGGHFFLGLDWFILNVLFTGTLFIPIENLFPLYKKQPLFREEWREDLFYYFVSSMLVQILAFLTLLPGQEIVAHTAWTDFRDAIARQPLVLQIPEIMLLTDLVQYWVHRAFHRIPFLWNFHAVHHSAKTLDWMAGARMHFIEILLLRGLTVIPMLALGYSQIAVQGYILLVYAYSTFIHTNVRFAPKALEKWIVLPRFHHWHHGIDREAIDVNFAIHFPHLDHLFGTHYLPEKAWPKGYGIPAPMPSGYIGQFLYPLLPPGRKKDKPAVSSA